MTPEQNGREAKVREAKTGNSIASNGGSDRHPQEHSPSNGAEERERGGGAVCTGTAAKLAARPRPVTHGKTLGYLIDTAQDRIAQIDHKVASLLQEIELLNQERNGISDRLEGLKQSLADWEGRVASLKVLSNETEIENYDPAEELTA
ncbi:hypothetical protein [Limnothrix sp. PR1529]|uniref:hypothetical protein n=1 Tax=Limnothrix sp. PR1529 TaxID=1704291 RepID=UPI00117B1FFE|nr:hypothetical protein [Limnothrix sp. PR1529]